MTYSWENLDSEKQVKFLSNGSVAIIKPKQSDSNIVPLFCKVCEFPMRNSNDFYAYKEFGCCEKCELKFARTNKEKWNNGWRPDKTSDIWLEYIKERKDSFKPILSFM